MTHYTGGCQCGATQFTVDADLSAPLMCNCSRCRRLGWAMAFVPATQFHLTTEGPLTEYLFNKQAIHHKFCAICGIESFSNSDAPDGTPMIAVNINCLDGVDTHAVAKVAKVFDGASI